MNKKKSDSNRWKYLVKKIFGMFQETNILEIGIKPHAEKGVISI